MVARDRPRHAIYAGVARVQGGLHTLENNKGRPYVAAPAIRVCKQPNRTGPPNFQGPQIYLAHYTYIHIISPKKTSLVKTLSSKLTLSLRRLHRQGVSIYQILHFYCLNQSSGFNYPWLLTSISTVKNCSIYSLLISNCISQFVTHILLLSFAYSLFRKIRQHT